MDGLLQLQTEQIHGSQPSHLCAACFQVCRVSMTEWPLLLQQAEPESAHITSSSASESDSLWVFFAVFSLYTVLLSSNSEVWYDNEVLFEVVMAYNILYRPILNYRNVQSPKDICGYICLKILCACCDTYVAYSTYWPDSKALLIAIL